MRSTTFRPRTGRIFLTLSAVAVLASSATGCGWANRMGEKLPVSGGAQRCTGQLFCFGGDSKPKQEAQTAADYRRPANMQGNAPQGSPPQNYPGQQGYMAQQSPYPPQGYAPPGFPPQDGMMPPPSAPQANAPMPVYKLPANAEEAKNMSYPRAGMPGMLPEGAPAGMTAEMFAPQPNQPIEGLKPYEQELPEMKKLEPVPLIESIKQDMEW